MKVRPINLKPWEARAIVAGTQTQIRRVVSPEPHRRADWLRADMNEVWRAGTAAGEVPELGSWRCPYGAQGDQLWGRESWQFYDRTEDGDPCVRFAADNAICWPRIRSESDAARLAEIWAGLSGAENYSIDNCARDRRWRSAIHMPRWASRIVLEVADLRVERLQAISEADAIAESCSGGHGSIKGYPYNATPREHFQSRWERTYGPGAWGDNPWVWRISVRRSAS
jgi:hypothetical protein